MEFACSMIILAMIGISRGMDWVTQPQVAVLVLLQGRAVHQSSPCIHSLFVADAEGPGVLSAVIRILPTGLWWGRSIHKAFYFLLKEFYILFYIVSGSFGYVQYSKDNILGPIINHGTWFWQQLYRLYLTSSWDLSALFLALYLQYCIYRLHFGTILRSISIAHGFIGGFYGFYFTSSDLSA